MNAQDLSNEILSDIEKDKVLKFVEDKVLFEAVKKYVLAVAVEHGVFRKGEEFNPGRNYALRLAWSAADGTGMPRSDEELGQDLRALTKAVQLVGSGFKEMAEMQEKVELVEDNENPAE